MIETVAILTIVGAVLILGGKSVYLTLTGKKQGQCCGCDSCMCGGVKKED
ncbi:hypothetical protein [Syntrophorhabdus aromaticivorans]|jgi:hypothetical protein|nr:hypothetical protein [Syntrophorhabdus aromaticivorans]